jgi:hypothetical protein
LDDGACHHAQLGRGVEGPHELFAQAGHKPQSS